MDRGNITYSFICNFKPLSLAFDITAFKTVRIPMRPPLSYNTIMCWGTHSRLEMCFFSTEKEEKGQKEFFFIWEKQRQLTRSRSHASIPEPSTSLIMSSKPTRGLGKHVTLSDTLLLVLFIPICAPLWQSVG